MDEAVLTNILSRLLGSEVSTTAPIKLTSVQQGAVVALARKQGFSVDRKTLSGVFSVQGILKGVQPATQEEAHNEALQSPLKRLSGLRIGCDIQSIEEFRRAIDERDLKSCAYLTDIFWPEEISYCENQADPVQSLCGLFAAKEAVFKMGFLSRSQKVLIRHDDEGRPSVDQADISISHSVDYCMAVAARLD